jgi:O-antigen ligase
MALAGSPLAAAGGVAGGLAVASAAAVLLLAPGRLADALILAAVSLVAVPLDKHFVFGDHVGGWPGIRLSAADLALLALLPLAAIGSWLGRVRNVVPRSLLVAYILWVLQYAVAAAFAARRDYAGFEILSALHALFTAVVAGALFRRALLRPALALLALQVVLHTGFATAQVVTGRPVGAGFFKGASIVQEALGAGATRPRPSGLFDHPIVYADVLLLTLPMLFAGLFVPGGRLWRAGLGTALVVGLGGLALTLSRGAWIGTAVAALCLVLLALRAGLLERRQAGRFLLWAGVAVLAAAPFVPRAWERLTTSQEGNLRVRLELNEIALSMIAANPLVGVGPGNFIPRMADYDPKNVESYFPATVHNLYLLEGAEAGVPGLLLALGVFGVVLIAGLRRLRGGADAGVRWFGAAVLAGLVGLLVAQLADFSHRLEPLRSLAWMNVGLLFALLPPRGPASEGAPR